MEPDQPSELLNQDSRRGYHDLGGLEGGPIDTEVTQARPWEKLSVVIGNGLGAKGAKLIRTDEFRRAREEMGAELYNELGYFEKQIASLKMLLIEKQVIAPEELEQRMSEIAQRISEHGR